VTQKRLDDSDIGAAFEQMGREAVAQRMQRHALLDPGCVRRLMKQAAQLAGGHRLAGAAERAGSVRRVPATEIETLVVGAVRERRNLSQEIDDRSLITTHVARVEVCAEELVIQLAEASGAYGQKGVDGPLRVAWQKTISTRRREFLLPDGISPQHARPIRSETRATLVASIARGRRWLEELIADATATSESIAKRERCSVRKSTMAISLAFLAPDLVKAAIDGRLPHGMGVTRLADLPAEWSRQHRILGLPEQ
jgi:site-specific DNA recombinase